MTSFAMIVAEVLPGEVCSTDTDPIDGASPASVIPNPDGVVLYRAPIFNFIPNTVSIAVKKGSLPAGKIDGIESTDECVPHICPV